MDELDRVKYTQFVVDTCTQELRSILTALSEELQKGAVTSLTEEKLSTLSERAHTSFRYFEEKLVRIGTWLCESNETTNFTYDVTEHNLQYMLASLSHIIGCSYEEVQSYAEELIEDKTLREHIRRKVAASSESHMMDSDARYGRRLVWYVLTRVKKPSLVVETGIDKGLGSLVLTTALMKNHEEGFPGSYLGTDINPKAGYLFDGVYEEFGEILYGDSVESLRKLTRPIDLFIGDSDHSADYEATEYLSIEPLLHAGSVLVSDNAHVTTKLLEFARQTRRQFLFIPEVPKNHWYPGAGAGIAFT